MRRACIYIYMLTWSGPATHRTRRALFCAAAAQPGPELGLGYDFAPRGGFRIPAPIIYKRLHRDLIMTVTPCMRTGVCVVRRYAGAGKHLQLNRFGGRAPACAGRPRGGRGFRAGPAA